MLTLFITLIVTNSLPGIANRLYARILDVCLSSPTLSIIINTSRNIIIAGDLNCTNINLVDNFAPCDGVQNKILDFLFIHGCSQYISEPTRLGHLLDVIITNYPSNVASVPVSDPLLIATTVPSHLILIQLPKSHLPHTRIYLWPLLDWPAIGNFLNAINWSAFFFSHLTPNAIWCGFEQIIRLPNVKFVPFRLSTCKRHTRSKPKHYPIKIRRELARKHCLYKTHLWICNPNHTIAIIILKNCWNQVSLSY